MKKKSNKVIPFETNTKPSKASKSRDGTVIEDGKIGTLSYEVYDRGVIHVFDKRNRMFKKDCGMFEDEMDKLNLDTLGVGKETVIKGSGANDHLIFKNKDGEINITLRKRGHSMVEKLKGILERGKRKSKTG